MPKLESAFIEGLEQALGEKQFAILPKMPNKSTIDTIDYANLIAVEERRLERAKLAYLAEIDTIEQYAENKKAITARIKDLEAKRDKDVRKDFNPDKFAKKVTEIVSFIKRTDVTPAAKNEALHTIIETIIYEKKDGNIAIFFHD